MDLGFGMITEAIECTPCDWLNFLKVTPISEIVPLDLPMVAEGFIWTEIVDLARLKNPFPS